MTWDDVFAANGVRVASRALLISQGATGKMLTDAVRTQQLVRARRDHYLLPTDSRDVISAIRVGGRMDCASALRDIGIFAFDSATTHVRLDHQMSRMRSTRSRFIPLTDQNRTNLRLHWWPSRTDPRESPYSVDIEDALAASLRCQAGWHALASIDNAIHQRALSTSAAERLFDEAPRRVQHLRSQIDGRAESGQETVLRMIAVTAGLHVELQVAVPDVGRVDMIVEGALVMEADSREAHDGWERHIEDRRRDLILGEHGYMALRPAYQHTMYEPHLVRASMLGLLGQSSNFKRQV